MFAAVGAAGISAREEVRARLCALGASTTTQLTVLIDGEEGLHTLAAGAGGNPRVPILGWFHLAMRLRHVEQAARSLPASVPSHARAKVEFQRELERLHWRLWHGKKHAV